MMEVSASPCWLSFAPRLWDLLELESNYRSRRKEGWWGKS